MRAGENMNFLKNSDLVFGSLYKDYKAYGPIRFKVVDDSVILVCTLRSCSPFFFEVYYTCLPIFGDFRLAPQFFDSATSFRADMELDLGKDILLPVCPFPSDEESTAANASDYTDEKTVIANASACTDYANNILQSIRSLEDCRDFYESLYIKKGKLMRIYLDILLYYGEFEKCSTILEQLLINAVKSAFANCNVDYPGDDQWRSYLHKCDDENSSKLERLLRMTEASNWKILRTMLADKKYAEPYSELLEDMKRNVKLLSKKGVNFGGKEIAMIDNMEKKLKELTEHRGNVSSVLT